MARFAAKRAAKALALNQRLRAARTLAQQVAHRSAVRRGWISLTALSLAAMPWLGPAPALLSCTMSALLQVRSHIIGHARI